MARRRRLDDVPNVYRRRANFDLTHRVPTTMNVGKLTPLDVVEVLPGDTWTMQTLSLVRLSTTLVRPIMDDIFLDTYSFFVPLRLCYDRLENVFGDSSPSAYSEPSLEEIPSISSFKQGVPIISPPGTVWDYLGVPSSISFADDASTLSLQGYFSLLPLRAFALIWNEFFRDQTVDQPVEVNLTDSNLSLEVPNNNAWSPTNYAGGLPPVRRYGDLFSTCVVKPQKGPAVLIPGIKGAPVGTSQTTTFHPSASTATGLRFFTTAGVVPPNVMNLGASATTGNLFGANASPGTSQATLYPANLQVTTQTGVEPDYNINALRTAFQLQKYLERDSIYGSRYREYLYAAYGVTSPDSRLQLPEFLAGSHNRLNISQVASTGGSATYSVGQYAGNINSLSSKTAKFSKSFSEHGYIITVGCIRYKHLYAQNVNRLFRRLKREDFYDPLFANLGQQAIYTRDVYGAAPYNQTIPTILGYNEAYADYRTIPDRVTAGMRPGNSSLGNYWSLADSFTSAPSLVDLVHEDATSFERVVTVGGSADTYPFVVDFNFPCSVARVVSPYSMPGYADHH